MGGVQGSTTLSAQTVFDIAAERSDHFYIGAQRSDDLLPLSAPALFDISAQRSNQIWIAAQRSSTSISARFFYF